MPRNVIKRIDMTEDGIVKLTLKLDSSRFEASIKEVLATVAAAYKWAIEGDNAKDLSAVAQSVAQTTDEIMRDMLSGGLCLYQKLDTYDKDPDELTAAKD
jgi:hypothetical protein